MLKGTLFCGTIVGVTLILAIFVRVTTGHLDLEKALKILCREPDAAQKIVDECVKPNLLQPHTPNSVLETLNPKYKSVTHLLDDLCVGKDKDRLTKQLDQIEHDPTIIDEDKVEKCVLAKRSQFFKLLNNSE